MLGVPYEPVPVDLAPRRASSAALPAAQPARQVPVLEDEGRVYWDSTAILIYIARKAGAEAWLPLDADGMAEVMQWLALAQNEIRYGLQAAYVISPTAVPGTSRSARHSGASRCRCSKDASGRTTGSHSTGRTSPISPATLMRRPAPEAGISLEPYPAVTGWIRRIEALPGWFGRGSH